MQDIEGVLPRHGQTLLAAPAQFVKPERRKRADQRKAGGERKQQRQEVVAQGQPSQDHADDGIDQAQEHGVGRHRQEIGDAPFERVPEVGQTDLADCRPGADRFRAHQDV